MKKILKILGILMLILVFGIAIIIGYLSATDIPSYEVQKLDYQHKSTPAAIERGQKLTMMLCAGCHMNKKTGKLTGKQMLDAPDEFGAIYSQNITQDPKYGIGEWTDGELLYLLRTGIKRDGQYTPPYMAKLPNMADEDVNAIIAFLNSDHPMVAPDPTPDTPPEPSLLTKILCRVAFKPFEMPKEPIPMPDTSNQVVLGKYLAVNLDCFTCHSADFKSNDYINPENSIGYFAGGNITLDEQGRVVKTANLTPDKDTGIGNWTKDEFIAALKYGRRKGGSPLQYPMLPYTQLSDKEAGAIYEYLQTIPAINNQVERNVYN